MVGGSPFRGWEGRDVDHGLEDAARLAPGLDAAVELREPVVAPAHEREQLAGPRANRHEAALQHRLSLAPVQIGDPCLDALDAPSQRIGGQALQATVEGGVDLHPLPRENLARIGVHELTPQEIEEVAIVLGVGGDGRQAQGLGARRSVHLGGDAALVPHQVEHQVATLARPGGIPIGRDPVGALDDGGDQAGLGHPQARRRLPEVDA